MNAEQLLAAYPACPLAVAFVELILCGKNEPQDESAWELMRRAKPPMSPAEILECIQDSMKDETTCRAQEAYPQTFTPEFRSYLAAKLGMM